MAIGDYVAAYGDYWDLAELKPDALEPRRQLQAITAVCPEAPEVCCWGRVGARARYTSAQFLAHSTPDAVSPEP